MDMAVFHPQKVACKKLQDTKFDFKESETF